MSFMSRFTEKSRLRHALICLLTILLFALIFLNACRSNEEDTATIEEAMDTGTFYEGVSVGGVDVSGLTADEATNKVQTELTARISNTYITFTNNDWSEIMSAGDFGITFDLDDSLQSAMSVGRVGSKSQMSEEQERVKEEGIDFPVTLIFDQESLLTSLTALTEELNSEPIEPTAEYTPNGSDRFAFTDGVDGVAVDVDQLINQITTSLAQSDKLDSTTLNVVTTIIPTEKTVDELKANTVRVSRVSTSYSGNNNSNRVHNLKLGAEKINGVMIKPGREFSFNDVVGARTEAKGWKMAATIVGGSTFEDDYGGGICQISTTLYNAVLKADLKVSDRKKHSIPSSYVDYGLDATVSYGSQDFKFVNNTDYPVYIFATVSEDDQKVYVSIYGRPLEDGVTINLSSKIIAETDPPDPERLEDMTASPGSVEVSIKERKGYTVEVYKTYVKDGQTVESVKLYTDTYRPVQGVIYVGIGVADETDSAIDADIPFEDDPTTDIPSEDDSDTSGDDDESFEIF